MQQVTIHRGLIFVNINPSFAARALPEPSAREHATLFRENVKLLLFALRALHGFLVADFIVHLFVFFLRHNFSGVS
jgi:hypothetical protein